MDEGSAIPKFSLGERDRRWKQVRYMMEAEGLDAIFVPPNTGLFDMFQANARYLTGLGGNHAMVAALFPMDGEVTAVSSPDIAKSVWLERQEWVQDIRKISTGWGFTGEVIARIKELNNIRRLGVTGLSGNTRFPEGTTSHGIVQRLRENLPGIEIVNANPLMERARFVKSREEIEFLRIAVSLVEQSLDVLAREAQPGVSENVVYARMLASIIENGGELPSMILWSAGWPQPESNQYMPTRRKLRSGDLILTEAEARWGGYIGQRTQPAFVGKASIEYRDLFARQQEALHLCYELMRPGITIGELADRMIGLSDDRYNCAILIHGRGLGDDSPIAIHRPRDATMSNWQLEENSVFIVKPMISTPDGSKRLYWGDTVVCTARGAQRLGKQEPRIIETE